MTVQEHSEVLKIRIERSDVRRYNWDPHPIDLLIEDTLVGRPAHIID